MVSVGGFAGNVGRYGALGRFSGISEALRNAVVSRLADGQGITKIRTALRGSGFKFTNQAMSEIKAEFQTIQAAGGAEVDVAMKFGTRYRYYGTAHMVDAEGVEQDVPLMFGHNERLSDEAIRQRFESTAEQVQDKGGIRNRQGNYELGEDIEIEDITITGRLRGAA